jgi:hypothetical protein
MSKMIQNRWKLLIVPVLSESEWNTLHRLAQKAAELTSIEKDQKVKLALEQIKLWINKGQSPIVFCRFIATAQYVAKDSKRIFD